MHDATTDGGQTIRPTPHQYKAAGPGAVQTATPSTPPRLLTAAEVRAALGGMGERRFHELRAEGIVPPPLELGPRALRWTQDDVAQVISRLRRRDRQPEPASLAEARAARRATKTEGAKP